MKRIVIYACMFASALLAVSCDEIKNEEAAVLQQDSTNTVKVLKSTKLVFKDSLHEFGDVNEGDFAKYEFVFTNTGNEPLYVRDAKASSGCTTPEWTKDTIETGDEGKSLVQFNSDGRPGDFQKTVTVVANTDPEATVITIAGHVIPKVKDISGPYIKDAN